MCDLARTAVYRFSWLHEGHKPIIQNSAYTCRQERLTQERKDTESLNLASTCVSVDALERYMS